MLCKQNSIQNVQKRAAVKAHHAIESNRLLHHLPGHQCLFLSQMCQFVFRFLLHSGAVIPNLFFFFFGRGPPPLFSLRTAMYLLSSLRTAVGPLSSWRKLRVSFPPGEQLCTPFPAWEQLCTPIPAWEQLWTPFPAWEPLIKNKAVNRTRVLLRFLLLKSIHLLICGPPG